MTVDIIFRTSIKRYMDDIAIFFNDDSVIDNPESASHLFSKELDLLGLMSHNSSSSKGYPSQTTRALFRCSVSIHKIRVSNQKIFARDRGQKNAVNDIWYRKVSSSIEDHFQVFRLPSSDFVRVLVSFGFDYPWTSIPTP